MYAAPDMLGCCAIRRLLYRSGVRAFKRAGAISSRIRLAVTLVTVAVATTVIAAIDRHPELKSRALAWTEYDGSFLVDTSSRAEMLDFYWTVFARPYPLTGWTGSLNPPVAGQISEQRRIREIAQLNAYRALNYSPAASEDPTKIDFVQAGALVLSLNPTKPIQHTIDSTWIGYNETAAQALATSLLTGYSESFSNPTPLLSGPSDTFIDDPGTNGDWVGHRTYLLHDNSVKISVGAVADPVRTGFISVWNSPLQANSTTAEHFIAWPAPGYAPIGVFSNQGVYRWSFVPVSDNTAFDTGTSISFFKFAPGLTGKDTTVTAKINGLDVPIHNLIRNIPPGPLTWDFDPTYLDFNNNKVADGTVVEISVHDVAEVTPGVSYVIAYHDYKYTATFFDENKITPASYAPKTALVNMSTRSVIGRGDQQMIAGFSVAGITPVRVAIRTQGPGLTKYGIQNAAGKTHITVYDSNSNVLGENSSWKQHQDWRLIQSLGLAPDDDNEAAMVLTLWPGNYSAIVGDDTGTNGVGIVEAFNIDNLTSTRLANLSTRGLVGDGENQLIAGIIIKDTPRAVVIRTQGPGLARYGVSNPVPDTTLTLVAQDDHHIVAQNDDWQTDPRNARLSGDLNGWAPSDPREAALIVTLPPGGYSALVSGKGAAGVGIIEVFDLSP